MKKLTAIVSACLIAGSICAQEKMEFTLTVRSKDAKPTDKVFLCYQNAGGMKIDSVGFTNAVSVIKGETPKVQHAFLYVQPGNSGFLKKPINVPGMTVYLEKGNITMDITGQNSRIGGTPSNIDYQTISDQFAPYKEKEDFMEKAFYEARSKNDTTMMEKLKGDYQKLAQEEKEMQLSFFNSHLDSEISLDWLNTTYDIANSKEEATRLFNKLTERLRKTPNGKMYATKLASIQAIEPGNNAPDFSAPSLDGSQIALNSFRGKYLLIDFWASWCGPCRRENPNVVKAYQTYNNDKFDILGVSLDESKEAWKAAVEKDGLTWPQVSDLGGWQSVIASTYGVRSIPANFLLDPNGKIIARDLRGKDLEDKLKEIFKH